MEKTCFGAAFLLLLGAMTGWAPRAFAEDARVLPQGRSRFSVIYAQTGNVSQTFNSQFKAESLTAQYNMDLNSVNITRLVPEFKEVVNVLNNSGWHYNVAKRDDGNHGLTRDNAYPALGDAVSRGSLGVDAEALRQQYNLAYQFGVTDRLTVGAILPFMRMQVRIKHSLGGVNTANDAYYAFAARGAGPNFSNDLVNALDYVRSANDETLQSALAAKGYSRFGDSDVSGLGDLILGARYCYLWDHRRSGEWISSVQAGVVVPTGRLKPTSELTQVDFGAGSYDLGVAHIINYSPVSWVTFSNGLHYTYRFWGHRMLRVRKDPTDEVPDASDEEDVQQRLGDKYSATLGTTFNISRAISIDTSYEWWWKKADLFRGSRGRDYGYSYLAADSDSYTETLQIGASVSTIPAFLKHDIPVPGQLSANFYLPLRGKNSVIAPYGTAELALYF
jgi:hypothetical protein